MIYSVERECYCCEEFFTVLSEVEDISYCPFCGEKLEEVNEDSDED